MWNRKRWAKAQEYERSYWMNLAERITSGVSGSLGWYRWRADELEKCLMPYFSEEEKKQSAKVLELGSGPVGIISFLKWGERHAIDPLDEYYRSAPTLNHLRDPAVRYSKGQGEEIPFDDATFSLVIIDNVLDHVRHPEKVLDEIYRVLMDGGFLYLTVNVHTRWGWALHTLLSKLLIDQGHPYTFTQNSIRTLLPKHRFEVLSGWCQDYKQARAQDRRSSSMKAKIKGFTGLSEFVCGSVSRKYILNTVQRD